MGEGDHSPTTAKPAEERVVVGAGGRRDGVDVAGATGRDGWERDVARSAAPGIVGQTRARTMICKNRGLCAAFIAAILASGHVMPARAANDLGGTYSSVRNHPYTGDVMGAEVEVRTTPRPTVVVTICEGSCWGGKVWPAVITKHQISFSVVEDLVDQDGRPVPQRLNFVATFEGGSLVLKQKGVPAEKLRRVAHPRPGQTARLGCDATVC